MSSSRHRAEPARWSLPGLARQAQLRVVAAGVGAALVGATVVVTLRPDDPSSVPSPASVAAARALRAEAALRADQRISRDKPRATAPAVRVAPAPAPAAAAPRPAPPKLVVKGQLWVKSQVNVRSGPSTDDAKIGSLKAITKVGVTGAVKSGWTQVLLGTRGGWVRSTYLSTAKPQPPAQAPAGVSNAKCSKSTDIEPHLSTNARAVYRAVCAAYGSTVKSFGGYRAGDDGDHGSGRAVDIMVSGDPGHDIARYVQTHAKELGVTYVIYQQRMWFAGHSFGDWEAMEDRGSATANHFDHVHVSVD